MSERHPILDAPQEKRDEALELVMAELQGLQTIGAMNSLSAETFADLLLAKLDRIADTRIAVSREAYEILRHWRYTAYAGWFRWYGTLDQHSESDCRAVGGRCAFRPEDE